MDTPLNAISWEKSLLGTVLADPSTYGIVEDMRFNDFTGSHQDIWLSIVAIAMGGGVDKRSVIERLRSQGMLESVGADFDENATGEDYINLLITRRGENIQRYRKYVEGASIRRSLKKAGYLIQVLSAEERAEDPSEDLIEEAIQKVLNIRRHSMSTGVRIGDVLNAYTHRMDGIRNGTWSPAWKPYTDGISDMVGYVEPTEYITVGARPGEGKSSFLRFEAWRAAKSGKRVAMFNLENDEIEYAKAVLALETGIDTMRMKVATQLSVREVEAIRAAAEEMASLPLHIITQSAPPVKKITSTARHLIATEGLDLIFLDYVQLVENGKDNKVADVSQTSTTLRAFALENKVPIVQAAQLNRSIETRQVNSKPVLSDLRESGSLEQDSTQVWFPRFVWNDPTPEQQAFFRENLDPNSGRLLPEPVCVPIRFHLAKVRNGRSGISRAIKWNKATGNYQTLEAGTL